MRNIFLFFFSISFGFSLAQTELLNQNFNNGNLSSWSFIDGDMAAPYNDPMVSSLSSSFHLVEDYDSLSIGDSIMAANSWFNDTIAANNFIITPALTFTNDGNYLNFQAKSLDGSYPEALQVFCSQYLEKDSILNSMLFFDTIALPNLWTDFQVKLEGIPLNTPLYIAFRHYSND
ncbi:MAG: choice-of-anchor J domain-containing protein [Flavobacteriales bacterium]|nr:choice-of-anchor J domain-containing protein [Flavobacteriales bacterium]